MQTTRALHLARTLPFRPWVERCRFKADRERINFTEWPFLGDIYDCVPPSVPMLEDFSFVLMCAAQSGKSIFAMCLALWLALKIDELREAYYLPTDQKALDFSQNRFIRLARENPGIHRLMGDPETPHERKVVDEGQSSVRRFLHSLIYFFSLMGKITTESNPLDALHFDEVQDMPIAKIEKAHERLGASRLRIKVYASTAMFEGSDIDYFFQRSDQRHFHTRCGCPEGVVLGQCWDPRTGPTCIDRGNGSTPGVPHGWFYVCPRCKTIITRPQDGQFIAHRPEVRMKGVTFPQMLSPRHTATSILEKWRTRVSVQNFFGRTLGRPYTDPTTVPITDAVLEAAQNPDLRWGVPTRQEVDAIFLGLDQRQHEIHAVVKAKVGDRQRLLHIEVIQAANPWRRAAEMIGQFHVRFACLEALPNTDPAYALAHEFPGRVFVVDRYSDMAHQILAWGDRPQERTTERRSTDEFKTPFTVAVDRYKMMSLALYRWAKGEVETPDARTLIQSVRTDEGEQDLMLCRDMFWDHMKHVALVTEPVGEKEDEIKLRAVVKKLGPKDPHFAFANMLCDVAFARAYGTTYALLGDHVPVPPMQESTSLTAQKRRDRDLADQLRDRLPHLREYEDLQAEEAPFTCADCAHFDRTRAFCKARTLATKAALRRCDEYFEQIEEEEKEWT